MALKRHGVAREVMGLSRSPETLRRAKQRRAIDIGTTDAKRAVQDADLVVIATPVETIVPHAKRLARFMRSGSVLTDVGSTKAHIVQTLERALPRNVAFVGGHPLAGSEQRGFEAADVRLFDGSIFILTPTARTPRQALRRVIRFWKPLVHRVVTMSPLQHDRVLAGTSHLPHLLAYCLALAVDPVSLSCAPRSFLEATRVAKSDPDLWDDIFLTNRTSLLIAMDRFDDQWYALRRLLARPDRTTLRRLLASAKSKRDALENRDT
jgi:prephenate dehydrogenase